MSAPASGRARNGCSCTSYSQCQHSSLVCLELCVPMTRLWGSTALALASRPMAQSSECGWDGRRPELELACTSLRRRGFVAVGGNIIGCLAGIANPHNTLSFSRQDWTSSELSLHVVFSTPSASCWAMCRGWEKTLQKAVANIVKGPSCVLAVMHTSSKPVVVLIHTRNWRCR